MKKEKSLEEQLRNLRISKDDPRSLKKKIQELETKLQQLEQKSNIAPSREEICPILKRKTGDGRIEVVNERVACEYSRIDKKSSGKKYGECGVTDNACPYTGLPGYSEV